ncbi:excalibur calcium-binding domain-containing protein [Streptomyces sp. P1-3]|uniref:excalibur calcium-binding domain-containing protein n=1 Tax=Streptomyces sp. P1-3 TaxID=3421658 RepID=UPI003D35DDC7
MSRILSVSRACVLAGTMAVAVAGVSGCGSDGEGKPEETRKTVTSTQTVTTTTAEPTPSPTRPSPPPKQTATPTPDARSTVEAYFDAINARDYRRAWDLGGKNLSGGTYTSFKEGFADTVRDTVHIVDVRGDTVTVTLDAHERDGTIRSFGGTYTVRAGVIVAADIREATSPTEPPPPGTTYPPGPPAGMPDVDCDDLDGPVWVGDNDPHRLDADGDGIGCEEN